MRSSDERGATTPPKEKESALQPTRLVHACAADVCAEFVTESGQARAEMGRGAMQPCRPGGSEDGGCWPGRPD
jgi:hypothetical protein